MITLKRKDIVCPGTVVLLLSAIIVAGCSSSPSAPPGTPFPLVTSDPDPVRTITTAALPVTTAPPLQHQTTAAPPAAIITTSLPYGITISRPHDWMMEETGVVVTRDYGREVLNIANFFSPAIRPGRDMPGPNPDRSRNTILTIDADNAGETDLESYYNHAVLALQDEYGSIDITGHNAQIRISGYRSYQLDFDTDTIRGKYLFTKVGGTMYIFGFTNPSPYSSEVEAMYRSIIITP